NLHARADDYAGKTRARLMLGPRHALIRRDLRARKDWRRLIQDSARKVLITLGGADPGGHTGRALEAMLAIRERSSDLDLQVHAVVGAANPRLDTLRRSMKPHDWIQISWDVWDMGQEIRWCDLALSASGSTVWELVMFQTPMLLGTASAVEEPVAASLAAVGAAKVLGRLRERSVEEISAAVEELLRDQGALARLSDEAAKVVDGEGTSRVIDQMLAISRGSG
ncbi:MAG: hypothetical protein P8N43_00535, partial [Alphaproteobacteria bacterium]|nr:hypothetical protein [Alphaproteobacteria bacterium]